MGRFGARVRRMREVPQRLDRQRARIAELEREIVRLSPQVAALQEQLERLRQQVDATPYAATDEEQVEARSLVEEVRAEHSRVRARITAATVFEERLRVLEQRAGVENPAP